MKNANTLSKLKRCEKDANDLYKGRYRFFDIRGKRQLELLISKDDNKSCSTADCDNDYYYSDDAVDEADFTYDANKDNAVICID